jgi:hypothetical protein
LKENEMTPKSAALMMRVVACISIITSALFAIGGVADPTGLNDLFFQYASTGTDGVAGIATQEAKLAVAIAGGIFAGISAMLLFVAAPAIEAGNPKMIRGAQLSLLTWFVVDSSASAFGGNAVNIIPNIVVLLVLMAPMMLAGPVEAPA